MYYFNINLSEYSEEVRKGIILETNCQEIIVYAKSSEDYVERAAVALNPNISTLELDELSRDPNNCVKRCVLMNKTTSGETIDAMLTDEEETPDENLIVNHPNVLRKTLERFVRTHRNKSLKIVANNRLKYM